MGYFDSIDVQDALARKRAYSDARVAALAALKTVAQQFVEAEFPEVMSEFVSKAAALVEPMTIPGTQVDGWLLGHFTSLNRRYEGTGALVYYGDSDCSLYFCDQGGACGRVEYVHLLDNLADQKSLPHADPARISAIADDLRPHVLSMMQSQLERLTRPGAGAFG